MVGTLRATDSKGKDLEDDGAVFGHGRGFFEDMKGVMIRAAIAYLEDLQSKPVTKERLIDKGMLESVHIDTEPEVVVGIYEDTIQEGINLLKTWVREPDPSALRFNASLECLVMHQRKMQFTSQPFDSWTDDQNCNYHFGPIKKGNWPMVLKSLNMAGMWHYTVWFDAHYLSKLERRHCQEIVAFLDRVMPFVKKQFNPTYMASTAKEFVSDVQAFKRVFELCPEGGSVVLR